MKTKVFIDGSEGTTGLRIHERFAEREDIELIAKDYERAQKECNETLYWLELLVKTDYLTKEQYDSISADANELKKILSSITKTAKENCQ